MADNDGPDLDGHSDNGHALDFDAGAWAPAKRQYGLFYLMVIRSRLLAEYPEKLTKPAEVEQLKFVDSRVITSTSSSAPGGKKVHGPAPSEDESDEISEGEPYVESDVASWPGKRLSWWRVHSSLGEDLVVREGLSLASAELFRVQPGEAVQQAGAARLLMHGRCRGCIRLPVKPRGWVTADAVRAGGPRYLVSATAPRWRCVHSSNNSSEGDAIIRAEPKLDSAEVSTLYCGDIVEQAGPSETRGQGILRMPVTSTILRRSDGDADLAKTSESSKIHGWVTLDASSAGGPVFFKPATDIDSKRRRRRPENNHNKP